MDKLFAQFLKERRYLKNVTDRTLGYYDKCFRAFTSVADCTEPSGLTKRTLQTLIVGLRDRGHHLQRVRSGAQRVLEVAARGRAR
jgi:hypothetical protein